MRQGLLPFSESQNQYDFDQLLFISCRFTLVLSICREEIGTVFDQRQCVSVLLLWPFSKVHSATGLSTSKLILYSHEFSLHFSSSVSSHAHFHVWLVRMFVTDCFCFLYGTTGLIWVTFLKVPDSVALNEWEWWIHGLSPCAHPSLLSAPETIEVVMMRKPYVPAALAWTKSTPRCSHSPACKQRQHTCLYWAQTHNHRKRLVGELSCFFEVWIFINQRAGIWHKENYWWFVWSAHRVSSGWPDKNYM